MTNKLKYIVGATLCSVFFLIPAQAEIVNLNSNMDCAQANAGVGTCGAGGTGTGVGTMTFDTVTNVLSWDVAHSGLSSEVTAAHFHGPALPDQNAGVQVGMGLLSPDINSTVLTPAQATDLLAGMWYINIHSASFPAGEIRGQVDVVSTPTCDLQLNQLTYFDGDTITADVFRIANLTQASLALELKVWLTVPGIAPISVFNLGSDGSFVFTAGTDIDIGPQTIGSVTAGLTRGEYEFSCRILDPVTGELLVEDLNVFEIQTAITYAIGDTGPAGGIVFHITNAGLHGLEAAPVDQGTAEWGCRGTDIPGADRIDMDAGSANTADILAGCATPGIAAELADNYSLNGFDDWFLPSVEQLNGLYLHKDVVGGFDSDLYWTSSEILGDLAWFQYLSFGGQDATYKNSPLGVRAVRAF